MLWSPLTNTKLFPVTETVLPRIPLATTSLATARPLLKPNALIEVTLGGLRFPDASFEIFAISAAAMHKSYKGSTSVPHLHVKVMPSSDASTPALPMMSPRR